MSKQLLVETIILCMFCFSTAVGQIVDPVVYLERTGTKNQFDDVYKRVENRIKSQDLVYGRAIFRRYGLDNWNAVVSSEDAIEAIKPLSLSVCDFVGDFAELRDRQDWCILRIPDKPVDINVLYAIDVVPLFNAWKEELLEKSYMIARTVDRSYVRDNLGRVRMGLPTELGEKAIYDFRLIGWCEDGQWRLPTTMDAWLKTLSFARPFSIERLDDMGWRLVFDLKQQTREVAWVLEFDKQLNIVAVRSYRVVQSKEEKLVAVEKPLFESRFSYVNKRIARLDMLDSLDPRGVTIVTFSYPEEFSLDESIFQPEGFLAGSREVDVTSALKSVLELELQQKK